MAPTAPVCCLTLRANAPATAGPSTSVTAAPHTPAHTRRGQFYLGRKEDSPVNHDLMWTGLVAKEKRELRQLERTAAERLAAHAEMVRLAGSDEPLGEGFQSGRQYHPVRAPIGIGASVIARRHFSPAGSLVIDSDADAGGGGPSPAPASIDTSRSDYDRRNARQMMSAVWDMAPDFKTRGRGTYHPVVGKGHKSMFTAADMLHKEPPPKKVPYWKTAGESGHGGASLPRSKSASALPRVRVAARRAAAARAPPMAPPPPSGLTRRDKDRLKLAKRVTHEARLRYRAELRAEQLNSELLDLKMLAKKKAARMRQTIFDTIDSS